MMLYLMKYKLLLLMLLLILGLNAKPCGILDFAHTTHGLNP